MVPVPDPSAQKVPGAADTRSVAVVMDGRWGSKPMKVDLGKAWAMNWREAETSPSICCAGTSR